jgi:hypothetical protein
VAAAGRVVVTGTSAGSAGRLAAKERRLLRRMLRPLAGPVTVRVAAGDGPYGKALAAMMGELERAAQGRVAVTPAAPKRGDPEPPWVEVEGPGGILRLWGVPSGYLFGAFISDLLDVAAGGRPLDPASQRLAGLVEGKGLALTVLVAPTCPHGPRVVRWAHRLRLAFPTGMAVKTVSEPHVYAIADTVGVSEVPAVVAEGGGWRGVWSGEGLIGGASRLAAALAEAWRQWEAMAVHENCAGDCGDAELAGGLRAR